MNAHQLQKTKSIGVHLLVILCFAVFISGCSVKLNSSYDEVLDQFVTNFETKIDTFLIKMERLSGTPEGDYNHNAAFYDEVEGALNSIVLRSQTLAHHDEVVEQVSLLQKNVANLKLIHQKQGPKGLEKAVVEPLQAAFDTQFTAILKLQDALKRGEKSPQEKKALGNKQ